MSEPTEASAPETAVETQETAAPVPDPAAVPAVEAPKEPELDPKGVPSEKETAYGRAVRKREAELVARQERFAQERQTVAQEKAAIAKERAELARLRAEHDELVKELDSDPLTYATKRKGWDEANLARRWMNGGKASAQEIEDRKEAERKAEIAELRGKIEAREKAEAERVQAEAQAKAKAAEDARISGILDAVTEHAKTLATVSPLAARAIAANREQALPIVNAQAAMLINAGDKRRGPELWTAAIAKFNELLSLASGSPAASQGSEATKNSTKPGAQVNSADASSGGKAAPTLTGKGAAQRSVIIREDDPLLSELDREAANAKTERAIEEALKARKAANA